MGDETKRRQTVRSHGAVAWGCATSTWTPGPRPWWIWSTPKLMLKPQGPMLDAYLTVSAPFREAVEKAMLKTLEQLAMPTRADVVSIAERMTNIEMRLDDLDAKLDSIREPDRVSRAESPGTKRATNAPGKR